MRTEGFAFLLVRSDRQNLPEHGRAVWALHARADKNGKIYQTKLRARCKASPVIRTKIKSRHFLKTESVDFYLCKKYVIMKQKRGNKNELYKASKRVLWKAQ